MKRVFALLLSLLILLIPVNVMAEGSETVEEEPPSPYQIRYYFEHRLLPSYFYHAPEDYIKIFETNGIFPLWKFYTSLYGFDLLYTEEEFDIRNVSPSEDVTLLMLKMPEPEDSLLCFRVYLYYDKQTGEAEYYTIEYDLFFEESSYLCAWTKDMVHKNYGPCALFRAEDEDYETKLSEEAARVLHYAE